MHTQNRTSVTFLCAAALATLLVAGCSKTETPAAAPTLADAKSSEQIKAAVIQKEADAAPKGDPSRPLASYEKLDSGAQLYDAWLALSNMPVDYDKVSEKISRDYNRTQDAFKRKDIAAALKPAIDQEIAKARQSGYVVMDLSDYPVLESFDFAKKTFAIKPFADASGYRYFNDLSDVTLTFSNPGDFRSLAVTDEARARDIESRISKYGELQLRVFMFFNGVVPGEQRLRAQIMKVQLTDRRGNVLQEQ